MSEERFPGDVPAGIGLGFDGFPGEVAFDVIREGIGRSVATIGLL